MSIEIRIAELTDAMELLEIYRPYVTDTAITFEYDVPTVDDFQNRIKTILEKYPYFVAIEDGAIVGYAYASAFKGRAAYDWSVETSIYVKEGHKGNGIGKALYERLEEALAKQNITNVNACIAYPEIEDAYLTKDSVYFHEKFGYKMVGMFHNCAYKFDSWYHMVWMEKFIGEHKDRPEQVIWFNR